jgi:isocitrate/isopropylmalate dehydrogenase
MSDDHDPADSFARLSASGPEAEDDVIDRGVSEFGDLLGDLLAITPGACGAVLSDGVDDQIDTAYRPAEISALDIAIAGAQVGQPMTRLNISTTIFGLGRTQVVIEAGDTVLISKVLYEKYLLTMVLNRRANIARAMRDFEDTGGKLLEMLR